MEHTEAPTPIPWKIKLGVNRFTYDIVSSDECFLIAQHAFKENAQFIVKAVNNHEKLVEALRGVEATLLTTPGKDKYMVGDLARIREILAELE